MEKKAAMKTIWEDVNQTEMLSRLYLCELPSNATSCIILLLVAYEHIGALNIIEKKVL
jgi:hypothetical protein